MSVGDFTDDSQTSVVSTPKSQTQHLQTSNSSACTNEEHDSDRDLAVERMLDELVIQDGAHFRHQTRSDEIIGKEEKMRIAKDLYYRKPSVFLERFGRCLNWPKDRHIFTSLSDSDDAVRFLVDQLDRECEDERIRACASYLPRSHSIRNRRLNAVHKLELGDPHTSLPSDYFSHEAMRHRDPILWESMFGKYLDSQARRTVLDRDYNTFSGYLLGQLQEREQSEELQKARIAQKRNPCCVTANFAIGVDLSDDEIDLNDLEGELRQVMRIRFVNGQDIDFDYNLVDNDDTLDEDEQKYLDDEERYFDAD